MEKSTHESVQELGSAIPPSPATQPKGRTLIDKLGVYNIFVLSFGTIIILACMGFLAFLWYYPASDQFNSAPYLWHMIVSRGWTSRVVTLATVLMRVALAAQLCVFAALIAAVILERVGASHEDFPLLSMMRCANTGPNALLWNVLHTIFKGSQLRYSFLIVITVLNALTLQFMSTMLLADFDTEWVVLDPRTEPKFPFAIGDRQDRDYVFDNFWTMGRNIFPSFAEWKQNGTQGPSFSDTGKTYRGFIPYENATLRDNLNSFSGPMTVVDERVICVKPSLTNLEIRPSQGGFRFDLKGTLSFKDLHPDVLETENVEPLNDFVCGLSYNYQDKPGWPVSVCEIQEGSVRLANPITAQEISDFTRTWLVLNTTFSHSFRDYLIPENSTIPTYYPISQLPTPDGPWGKAGNENITIDTSLCLTNSQADVFQVNSGKNDLTRAYDRLLSWDPEIGKYDTELVRARLNALSAEEMRIYSDYDRVRGVLHLQPKSNWSADSFSNNFSISGYQIMMGSSTSIKTSSSYNNSNPNATLPTKDLNPLGSGGTSLHRSFLWLTQDVLNSTRDPALAVQALTHSLLQTAFYDMHNKFDLTSIEVHTELEPRYIPFSWLLFIVVSVLLGLHFFLLGIALIWFFTRTELSLLGNAWQAVAQVMSDDTKEAIHHGSMATDQELRSQAETSARIRIAKREDNGRLEAVSMKR